MTESNLDKLFDALKGLTHRSSSAQAPSGKTFLLVGLGNPGREYADTRHNIGFLVVSRIAERLGVSFLRMQSKALITDGVFEGHKIILVKPQSYMNMSGHPVSALLKFYKIPLENLLVTFDDVDLPFEAIRLKAEGGSGGHKGIQSIIEQLGTQDFPRLRLGVGRPPGRKAAADYVLKPFSKAESEFLPTFLDQSAEAALAFIRSGIDQAMTDFNRGVER